MTVMAGSARMCPMSYTYRSQIFLWFIVVVMMGVAVSNVVSSGGIAPAPLVREERLVGVGGRSAPHHQEHGA
jgi:hypothetical protein